MADQNVADQNVADHTPTGAVHLSDACAAALRSESEEVPGQRTLGEVDQPGALLRRRSHQRADGRADCTATPR